MKVLSHLGHGNSKGLKSATPLQLVRTEEASLDKR